jgi:hypothetical protein
VADLEFSACSSMAKIPRARWLLAAALLAGVLSSAGCAGGSVQGTGPGSALIPSAAIRFCDTPTPGCASSASLSSKSQGSLYVLIAWSNVPAGTHAQIVRFVLPSGEEYQAVENSFAVTSGPLGAASTLVRLPVAGTFIGRGALTGNWSVEVSIDGVVVATPTFRVDR